jgi:FlaA1/EpsC-like NDP-sugar epimerase
VKIVDLARDLIRLSGLEVGTDVEIRYTGMRPGEKLYEEMFFDHEHAEPTDHPKVLCAHDELPHHHAEQIREIIAAAMQGVDDAGLLRLLHGIVPDFTHDGVAVKAPALAAFGAEAMEPGRRREPKVAGGSVYAALQRRAPE